MVLYMAGTICFGVLAETWIDPDTGFKWTYRLEGDTAAIYGGIYCAISPSPTGTLTIPSRLGGRPVTIIGAGSFCDCSGLTSVTIPKGVTIIGQNAFSGCSGLTSVTIPDSVTSIMGSAFEGCSGLTNVVIGIGVTSIDNSAFSGCSGLTSVTIPDSVTSIWGYAFKGCSGLTSVTIPDSVTIIGGYAFEGCSGLTSVTIPDSVTSIGGHAFLGCNGLEDDNGFVVLNGVVHEYFGVDGDVTIPDGVVSINDSAFSDHKGLTSVTIPDSVTSIGDSAFWGCSGLTGIFIPNSVMSIGNAAFDNCDGLSQIIIPNSVTNIGYGAFSDCVGLTNVIISEGVSIIGCFAFGGCLNLSSLIIPNSVTNIDSGAFSQCDLEHVSISSNVFFISDTAFYYKCNSLMSYDVSPDNPNYMSKNGLLLSKDGTKIIGSSINGDVVIPEGVASISTWPTFYYVENMTSLSIPSSVTEIDFEYFYTCSSLTSIVVAADNPTYLSSCGHLLSKDGATLMVGVNGNGEIPNGVRDISPSAFRGRYLSSVTIPDSVTNIGKYAFFNCANLSSIVFEGNAPSVVNTSFKNVSNSCCIKVRFGSVGWAVDIPGEWQGVPIDYTVPVLKFNANGGILGETVHVSDGGMVGELPVPMRTGYAFAGWFTGAVDGDKIEPGRLLDRSVRVYAHWMPNQYEVTFDANGGEGGMSVTQDFNTLLNPPVVTREHYQFLGWSPEAPTVIPASNMTYTAQWKCDWDFVELDDGTLAITGVTTNLGENVVIPDEIDGKPVRRIARIEFGNCGGLRNLTIPDCTTEFLCGVPGLLQVKFDSAFDTTSTIDDAGNVANVSGVVAAYQKASASPWEFSDPLTGKKYSWSESNSTYAYFGQMYMTVGKTYVFGANFDDNAYVKVDGNVLIRTSTSESVFSNSSTVYVGKYLCGETGWHDVEFRLGDISGAKGGWGSTGKRWSDDFGLGYRDDGGTTTTQSQWKKLLDAGDGTLFRCFGVGGGFVGCEGLKSITMPWHLLSSMTELFPDAYTNIESIVLTGDAVSVPTNAFAGCSSLRELVLPACVADIGAAAFRNCRGLIELEIPNGVTNIGSYAFYGCSGLTSVTIPEGVENICDYAFRDCRSLIVAYVPERLRGKLSANVFEGCHSDFAIFYYPYTMRDGGAASWRVDPDNLHGDDEQSLRSGAIGNEEESLLEMTVPRAGRLSFWWKASSEHDGDSVFDGAYLTIDDKPVGGLDADSYALWGVAVGGETGWTNVVLDIVGKGPHKIRWTYRKDEVDEGSVGDDCVWVSGIEFDPEPFSFAECLNDAELSVTTEGDLPWGRIQEAAQSHDGVASLRSGAIGNDQSSTLKIQVDGAGELSFWWKVSSERTVRNKRHDGCSFLVDGTEKLYMDGTTNDWQMVMVTIEGDGAHELTWTYQKDASDNNEVGEDCAWLDEVVWVPHIDPIPVVALDATPDVVTNAIDFAGFADAAVKAAIGGSAAEYNAFKTWADGVKGVTGDALAGEAAVVANEHAAAAYLLGAERLFEYEPTVEIGELSIGEGENAGTTAMAVVVTVKDGEMVVAVDAEKVAAMFEATSDLGDWTGVAKLMSTVTTTGIDANGKMTFVVTPGDGTASRAFLRIRR